MRFSLLFFLFFLTQLIQGQTLIENSNRDHLIDLGRKAYFTKDTFQLKTTTQELLKIYRTTNDSIALAKYLHYKALQHKLNYLNDSAYYYYNLSKNISKKLADSLAVGRRLLSIANLQRVAQDFVGSEASSIEALRYLEPIKSYHYLKFIYNNLGIASEELNRYPEALNYYKKALEVNANQKNNEGYLYILNNIGLVYQKQKQHKKAIEYFKKGLQFNKIEEKFPLNYALLLENLTASEFLLENTKNTLINYKEVLRIREREKDLKEISTSHINLSDYYKYFNQKEKALFHANQAIAYAKKTHNNKRWLEALKLLANLHTGKKANNYLSQYISLNDSLFDKERKLKNQFAKIRYETDKKEKENAVLKTENEKKQVEISYQKQQKTIGWLLASGAFLILLLSFAFFILRRRKLIYEAQLQKAEVREKERQQIAKSLHDEVAGDLRLLHQKLETSKLFEEAQKLEEVKDTIRGLSHKLSSVSFDKVSFKDQIINLVSDYFSSDFKIIVNGLQEHEWSTINDSVKRLLYLSIRESIQNSEKHAKASKIDIVLSVRKKSVFLSINDNGIGFDTTTSKKGIGLLNLEERVEELNGTLLIDSEIGKGTNTKIQIPLNAQKNKNLIS